MGGGGKVTAMAVRPLVAAHVLLLAAAAAGCAHASEADAPEPVSPPATVAPAAPQEPEHALPARTEPEEQERDLRQLAWVAVEGAEKVALVDLEAGEVVAEHGARGGPHNVSVGADGTAAIALPRAGRIALATKEEITFVDLGGAPHDPKPAGDRFVVANEGARRLDVVGIRGEHVASIELRAAPHDLAVAPSGDTAWVTLNGTDELAVVDLHEQTVRYVPTGKSPHDILFSESGQLWVTDWTGPVHVLRGDGELQASIELGEEAHHLAFTPDGAEAWITDHGLNAVFVVDTESLDVVARVPVPGAPHHVAITPDGALAAVADHDNGTLVVFDVVERERLRTIDVGAGPHGVWPVPGEP
jgi:YVTN family beta-propeller protein